MIKEPRHFIDQKKYNIDCLNMFDHNSITNIQVLSTWPKRSRGNLRNLKFI